MSLERQMYADIVALNSEIDRLTRELAEERENHNVTIEANSRLQHKVDCAIAKIKRLEIANGMVREARQRAEQAEAELSRYRNGAEVTGDYIDEPDNGHMWWIDLDDKLPVENGQRVKVLVMKEDGDE